MAYCLILSLFVLVKAVADSASSIILLTSGTEVERSLFRRFFFLPQPPPLPTGTHLSSTNLHIYSRLPPSSHIAVAACALLASMSESPRNPNPGLNGYQQDVMQTEVGALSLLVASQASAISAAFWPMNAIFDAHFVIWCISGVQRESISTVRCPCGKAATSWRVFGVAKF